jgi:hypothetical protein
MEILESLIKQLFTYCSERIRDHCCPLYPFLCGEELCNFFSWHGVVLVGDMLGPGSKCLQSHSKWPGPCLLGV